MMMNNFLDECINLPNPPMAVLFSNGNAIFLDDKGIQIPEFQAHRWRGIHLFLKKYPEASIILQGNMQLKKELFSYFLENIAHPEKDEFDPQPGG